LDYKDCASFIEKLIKRAAEITGRESVSTNILEIFDKVASYGPTQADGQPAGITFNTETAMTLKGETFIPLATAQGSHKFKNARLNIPLQFYDNNSDMHKYNGGITSLQAARQRYGLLAIGELIHLSGDLTAYNDDVLQQATNEIAPEAKGRYWHSVVNLHCSPLAK
jgi:hypothetical protein